jgi:uncharacterized protein (DUF2336 family)
MIVHDFLRWMRTAAPGERAEATGALARAYLHSPLEPEDLSAMEAAMVILLDDPSPLVRESLAMVLAPSPNAPPCVIHALAYDQGEIAALVLAQSPILSEAELIDALRTGDWRAQCAVACRATVSLALTSAIVEIGGSDASFALLQNPGADVTPEILLRIAELHGSDAEVRDELLAREDCPAPVRQAAIAALSGSLSNYVARCGWLTEARAERIASEATDKATMTIAGVSHDDEIRALVRHLRKAGRLTTGLILRALLSGNMRLFEEALADLAGIPVARVSGFVHTRRSAGFDAVYLKAGLPPHALPAFRAALDAIHEDGFVAEPGQEARLSRRMTERVLTAVDQSGTVESEQLLLLLRRFSAEAARDDARLLAEDLSRTALIAA